MTALQFTFTPEKRHKNYIPMITEKNKDARGFPLFHIELHK
jgi:hypothetical protein